jgi:YD repeat-containing protein
VLSQLQNGCAGTGCTNVQETYDYNSRLQPVRMQLGTASSNAANYCRVYNYYSGVSNPTSCATPSQGTSGNNGNVMADFFQDNANTGNNFTLGHAYDALNRLTSSCTMSGSSCATSGSPLYNLTFGYTADSSNGQYGNMSCVINGQTNGACPQVVFAASTNRATTISSSSIGYDAAGNVTSDPSTGTTHTYQWDAEGRLASIDSGSRYSIVYNALGNRAAFVYPSATYEYLYDLAGNNIGSPNNWSMVPSWRLAIRSFR